MYTLVNVIKITSIIMNVLRDAILMIHIFVKGMDYLYVRI